MKWEYIRINLLVLQSMCLFLFWCDIWLCCSARGRQQQQTAAEGSLYENDPRTRRHYLVVWDDFGKRVNPKCFLPVLEKAVIHFSPQVAVASPGITEPKRHTQPNGGLPKPKKTFYTTSSID